MTNTTRQQYTAAQIDILLNGYFRDSPRPVPYPLLAQRMGIDRYEGLDDLVWKLCTGYGGKTPTGFRRIYDPTPERVGRAGWAWVVREESAMRAALAGEGQLRDPKCDMDYIATVLARTVDECEEHWKAMNSDPLQRKGFGL